MKKLIKPFIFFVLALCIGLIVLYQFKDDLFFYNPTVSVKVLIMMQNPETGEYAQGETEILRISRDKPYTHQPAQKQYYEVNTEKSILNSASVSSSTQFLVYYDCKTCTVKFQSDKGTLLEGRSEISVRMGQTITDVAKFTCDGYDHVGYDKEVTKVYEDTVFNAKWELSEYKVYLHVLSGSEVQDADYKRSDTNPNCYVKSFDFTSSFTLPEVTMQSSEQIFNGWYEGVNGEGERYYEIEEGSLGDVYLYASYDVKTYELTFMLDGEWYSTAIAPAGENIYSAGIPAEEQIAGMGLNWYADESLTTLYKFDVMPQGGVTVYGKWEKDVGEGFLGWTPQGETIDSYEELLKYVHYARFYNLTSDDEFLEVTYCSLTQLESDVDLAISDSDFITSGIMTNASGKVENDKLYVAVFMESSNEYEYSLESTERNDTRAYEYFGSTKGERSGYTDFYIDSLPLSYKVETTIQLQYVVEHGYKPECKQYSPAEKVYEKARAVLNEILDEDFNDYEKVQAIYDWFVANVQYDFNVVDHIDDWPLYDAHYMEGVFYNQKAVCDGIAKAFSLMCNIEGIPAIEVCSSDHAWCKVKVNNEWYVVDPTHGRVHVINTNKAMTTHGEIFISDAQKSASGHTAKNHLNIVANGSYDYFANKKYTFNGELHDYVIESVDEFANLLLYVNETANSLLYLQIDLSYQIEGITIDESFLLAVQKLNSMGVKFGYSMEKAIITDQTIAHVLFG